jgi:hypothetical protein
MHSFKFNKYAEFFLINFITGFFIPFFFKKQPKNSKKSISYIFDVFALFFIFSTSFKKIKKFTFDAFNF